VDEIGDLQPIYTRNYSPNDGNMAMVICQPTTGNSDSTTNRWFAVATRVLCIVILRWYLPRDATQSAILPRQVVCPSVRP